MIADFTSIRRAASTLDEHIPPPRLWAKIASSIEEQQRQPWWQRQFGTASSGVGAGCRRRVVAVLLARGRLERVETNAGGDTATGSAPSSAPEPVPAEQHYEQAIAGLQQLADARMQRSIRRRGPC